MLPLTQVCVTLQQACAAWYNHIYQRALAWAPDILPVVIARWTDGVKNIRLLEPPYVGRSGLTHDPLHMATDIVAALKDHADNVQAVPAPQTLEGPTSAACVSHLRATWGRRLVAATHAEFT